MLLPTINDILFGRGNAIWNQEGNRRLRHIIEKYQKEYHLATTARAQKIQITHMIMKEIGATGARFMEYDRFVHKWYEVDRTQAIEKVSSCVLVVCCRSTRTASGMAAVVGASPLKLY
jgi:hypothetical protein